MKPLSLNDLLPLGAYIRAREEMRAAVIRLKRSRRVSVGPRLTFVFENRETLRFQVQEMVRAEELTDPRKIQEELDVYNALMPGDGELSATMFIEFTDGGSLRSEMPGLVGIESNLWLRIGESAVRAEYERGRSEAERTSCVHYLRFRLSPAQRRAFAAGRGSAALEARHPGYLHATRLPAPVRRSLAADLAGTGRVRRAEPSRKPAVVRTRR
ncbi:MAG: DUF3501 family protein [Planctomycetes bacterium]|nr:DUF3501 family protein [Planctomycetota bacterium]